MCDEEMIDGSEDLIGLPSLLMCCDISCLYFHSNQLSPTYQLLNEVPNEVEMGGVPIN